MTQPTKINSQTAFATILHSSSNAGKLLLVDFYADWCGPCRVFAPQFEELMHQYVPRGVHFAKVDVVKCKDLVESEYVSALPTCKLYKNKECICTILGANVNRIKTVLDEYALDLPVAELVNQTNDVSLRIRAVNILIKILQNIPQEKTDKSTSTLLQLSEPEFSECLLITPGCMEILYAAGFEEAEDALELPMEADLSRVKRLLDQLNRAFVKSQSSTTPVPADPTHSVLPPTNHLVKCILQHRKQTALYADVHLRELARSVIPTDLLVTRAANKAGCSESEVTPAKFLTQLISWFKNEYFRWAGDFKCNSCQSKLHCVSLVDPTTEELNDGFHTVEFYRCVSPSDQCSAPSELRFGRTENLKTLMRTKLGRCGEWANLFALFLASCQRASSSTEGNLSPMVSWFPACRSVLDMTDHVWCEVWLLDEQTGRYRWMHCDQGEVVFDQPLLYESGWRKQLTYVIGFTVPPSPCPDSVDPASRVDVQDVTWRYTQKFKEVRARRRFCTEQQFSRLLTAFHLEAVAHWKIYHDSLPDTTIQHPFSMEDILYELSTFLLPPQSPNTRLRGRQTGSVEWRKARGELGEPDLSDIEWLGPNSALVPNEMEIENRLFYLRYNSALDIYQRARFQDTDSQDPARRSSNVDESKQQLIDEARAASLEGWRSAASRWKNVERKVEVDWHMVYLAREEGSDPTDDGLIEWELDLRDTDCKIGKVSLFANLVNHHESSFSQLTLCSNPTRGEDAESAVCVQLSAGSKPLFECNSFLGSKFLRLQGRMWTNVDESLTDCLNTAWQHAQLFRQKQNASTTMWSLEWKVELMK